MNKNNDNSSNNKKTIVGNYQLKNRIGTGAYAEVFKAIDLRNDNQHQVAIKVIARDKIGHPKLQENLQSEIAILRDYNHINIVRLIDHFNSTKYIFLVLELCEGGDLSIYIKKYKSINEEISVKFLKQIVNGLLFLSEKSLIHRDLKPANVLMTECSENAILKIADFGFAKHLKETEMTQTRCGTPLYMSPEILENLEYDAKADVWSLGCIFYEMLCGTPPFKGANEVDLLKNIKTKPLSLPSNVIISKESISLLKGLLERNPIRRISLESFNDFSIEFSKVKSGDLINESNRNNLSKNQQRVSDVIMNPSNVNTIISAHTSVSKNQSNDVIENINVHPSLPHRRYSSDQTDHLHHMKSRQTNNSWLPVPVAAISSNLGKAIISFTSPSYKSRSRSSSADAACDGIYSGQSLISSNANQSHAKSIVAKNNKDNLLSSSDDFIIVEATNSSNKNNNNNSNDNNNKNNQKGQQHEGKKKNTPSPPQNNQEAIVTVDGKVIMKHLQNCNNLCNITNILISIADNLIKESLSQESFQKEFDAIDNNTNLVDTGRRSRGNSVDWKRTRGESIDGMIVNNNSSACSVYLYTLNLLKEGILKNKALIISLQSNMNYHVALQKINLSLSKYMEMLFLRVENCSNKLSNCSTSCMLPAPELVMHKAAIKLAQEASVEELLGNLERARNNYSDARTLLQCILVNVQDEVDKSKLSHCLSVISNQWSIIKELQKPLSNYS